jgi:small subunit ribosomal protein S6
VRPYRRGASTQLTLAIGGHAGSLSGARSQRTPVRSGAQRMHSPPAADVLQPLRPEEVGFSVRNYELMVILDPELEERTIAPSLDRFLSVVTSRGGSIGKVDIWGRRRLAYEINKRPEGIYAVIDINAEPSAVAELDRQLNLNESVLRTKLMRPEAH